DQNRRQRRHELESDAPMRGSLQHALNLLNEKGVSQRKIMRYLESARIVPVLTAHPTEVQRKSTLDLHREIAQQLSLSDSVQTPSEKLLLQQKMAGLIATLWHTRMLRRQKLTVLDEI